MTLGPSSTLARALELEPDLPRLLRRWVSMGGAFRVPGNTTPVSEWNVHCDPEAAQPAFAAWQTAIDRDPSTPRALALGLDVTERARLRTDHVVALARRAGSTPDDTLDATREPGDPERRSVASNPVVRFVADALRFYFEFHARYDGFYGAFIHDPLVVAAALDPSLATTEAVAVDVDTAGGPGDGQTIADWRGLWGRRPNVDVAVTADADAFLDRLIERVGGLAASVADGPGLTRPLGRRGAVRTYRNVPTGGTMGPIGGPPCESCSPSTARSRVTAPPSSSPASRSRPAPSCGSCPSSHRTTDILEMSWASTGDVRPRPRRDSRAPTPGTATRRSHARRSRSTEPTCASSVPSRGRPGARSWTRRGR